jgi:hypothetical protein
MSNPPGMPPDPNAPPTAPMPPMPPMPPAPPVSDSAPSSGYSVPAQYTPSAGVGTDPLVLPQGATFGAWFSKVMEVAKRSWKSALIIGTLGVAVPRAAVSLISALAGWGGGFTLFGSGGFFGSFASHFLGLLVAIIAGIAACYVAGAGWAAGTWALVQEAQTGQSANIGQAFSYGFKRATALFPWTVVFAFAFTIGIACVIPGLYVLYAFSMFGFAAVFERGKNPIGRSVQLTHNSATIGPTLGKVAILCGAYFVYSVIVGAIFAAITVAMFVTTGGFGYNFGYGLIQAIASLLMGPGVALLLIGLLPTYAELRNREAPLSTSQLVQELG